MPVCSTTDLEKVIFGVNEFTLSAHILVIKRTFSSGALMLSSPSFDFQVERHHLLEHALMYVFINAVRTTSQSGTSKVVSISLTSSLPMPHTKSSPGTLQNQYAHAAGFELTHRRLRVKVFFRIRICCAAKSNRVMMLHADFTCRRPCRTLNASSSDETCDSSLFKIVSLLVIE